jgi:hypothetical protein
MQLLLLMDAALANNCNTSSTKTMVNSCNNSSTHSVANLKNSHLDKQTNGAVLPLSAAPVGRGADSVDAMA